MADIGEHPDCSLEVAGGTDIGRKRQSNEDSYVILQQSDLPEWCSLVAAVFDGVGGRAHGAEASSRAAADLRELVGAATFQKDRWSVETFLAELLRTLHARLLAAGQADPSVRGMATTATVAIVQRANPLAIATGHVGDSPFLRIRDGQAEKLIQEDSLIADLIYSKLLTPQQAERHPGRHAITQALGFGGDVTPHVRVHPVQPGDQFLLCTDGLTNMVPRERIQEIVFGEAPSSACRNLVAAANTAGGTDNVSVVVINFRSKGTWRP